MALFFEEQDYLLSNKKMIEEKSPISGEKGVDLVVFQKCFKIMRMPAFPYSKKRVYVIDTNRRERIPVELWTQGIKKEAEILREGTRTPVKFFTFPIFLVLLFSIFCVYKK